MNWNASDVRAQICLLSTQENTKDRMPRVVYLQNKTHTGYIWRTCIDTGTRQTQSHFLKTNILGLYSCVFWKMCLYLNTDRRKEEHRVQHRSHNSNCVLPWSTQTDAGKNEGLVEQRYFQHPRKTQIEVKKIYYMGASTSYCTGIDNMGAPILVPLSKLISNILLYKRLVNRMYNMVAPIIVPLCKLIDRSCIAQSVLCLLLWEFALRGNIWLFLLRICI